MRIDQQQCVVSQRVGGRQCNAVGAARFRIGQWCRDRGYGSISAIEILQTAQLTRSMSPPMLPSLKLKAIHGSKR